MGCYKLTYNHLQIVRTGEDQSLGRGKNGVGFIVSGLNHAMHSVARNIGFKKYLRERLVDAGYTTPENAANMTQKEVMDMVNRVFSTEYTDSGTPSIKIDPNLEDFGVTDSKDTMQKGKLISTQTIGIRVGPSSFSSYMRLASTIGHELLHAYHNISGDYVKWFNMHPGAYGYHRTELIAHEWQMNSNAPMSCVGYFKHLDWIESRGFQH